MGAITTGSTKEDCNTPRWQELRHVAFLASCALVFCGLLLLFNLLPGLSPRATPTIMAMGASQCLINAVASGSAICTNAGYPYGYPSVFGLPAQVLTAMLAAGFGLSLIAALKTAYALLLGAAFAGCLKFFKQVTSRNALALIGTMLFLASPIVSLAAHGPMRFAFALLPTYVVINLAAIRWFEQARTDWLPGCGWLLALISVESLALFFDGYSFVMNLLLSGIFWLQWLLRMLAQKRFRRAMAGSIVALSSVLAPWLLYRVYIPQAHYTPMGLPFFRAQGIDTFLFFVPAWSNWLAAALGWQHHVTPAQVYSYGPSSTQVYLGYSFVACAIAACWMLIKRPHGHARLLLPILASGLLACILSIGPTLKWHDFNPDAASIQHALSASHRSLELGTGWIYQHVPGIDIMRALYRWQLLVRLALVTSAVFVLGKLLSRGRRFLALALGLLLVAETLPPMPLLAAQGRAADRIVGQLDTQALADLRHITTPGARTVFVQLQPNANWNQYLVPYLCAGAKLRCYNVGGDKNLALATTQWPPPVNQLIAGKDIAKNTQRLFQQNLASQVVVPLFDLTQQGHAWPPTEFPRAAVITQLQKTFSGFNVDLSTWYAVVRPGGSAEDATHTLSPPRTQPQAIVR